MWYERTLQPGGNKEEAERDTASGISDCSPLDEQKAPFEERPGVD